MIRRIEMVVIKYLQNLGTHIRYFIITNFLDDEMMFAIEDCQPDAHATTINRSVSPLTSRFVSKYKQVN